MLFMMRHINYSHFNIGDWNIYLSAFNGLFRKIRFSVLISFFGEIVSMVFKLIQIYKSRA